MPAMPATDVILKRFEKPDEVRDFPKGTFELVNIGGMTIGRATYQPGWRWSVDVGPGLGLKLCSVEHSCSANPAQITDSLGVVTGAEEVKRDIESIADHRAVMRLGRNVK